MADNGGYRVVPESLRKTQQSLSDTADRWTQLANQTLPSWQLQDGDLGLLGRMANIVQTYNSVVTDITNKVRQGDQSLRAASDALNAVATNYERQDEEYYAKFGWIQRDFNDVAPPPST